MLIKYLLFLQKLSLILCTLWLLRLVLTGGYSSPDMTTGDFHSLLLISIFAPLLALVSFVLWKPRSPIIYKAVLALCIISTPFIVYLIFQAMVSYRCLDNPEYPYISVERCGHIEF
jgi:hypothetical protein